MAYDDLRASIAALERAGELKRVRAEVDPVGTTSRLAGTRFSFHLSL